MTDFDNILNFKAKIKQFMDIGSSRMLFREYQTDMFSEAAAFTIG